MDREINRNQGRQLTPEERALRVRRLKRKRNFRIAIVVTGFILAISLIVTPIIVFAAFRVKTFTVEGTAPYTKEEVVAASGIIEGKSLILADITEAKMNIEKTLPYTDNVKITRKLPSGIVIRVESTEKAYAIALSNGTYAMLDGNMKVLEYAPEVPEEITLIKGAVPVKSDIGETVAFINEDSDESEEIETGDRNLSLILEITKAIADNSMSDIDLIDVSSRSNIYLIYQGRIVLTLGDSMDVPAKLSLGQRVINEENEISLTQSGTVNLTVAKKAYFNPSDPDDIKELVIFNGGEWEEKEPENPESEPETSEKNDEE
ncbi:MAG: FtsQ-type POTRA domain-containing protein [Clostridia bacterium]|nr:FtsQ-type POTRA domain-containing protein [Clostridia bacterium]MBQ4603673.1 FtsQ-type POTRA domain-containing protein [Clostridia bacterium]